MRLTISKAKQMRTDDEKAVVYFVLATESVVGDKPFQRVAVMATFGICDGELLVTQDCKKPSEQGYQ